MKDLNSILGLVDGKITVSDNVPSVFIYRDPIDVEAALWSNDPNEIESEPIILTRNSARVRWLEV